MAANPAQAKLPSFQFYPGDWRKDAGVQALDYHDRGVWHEILCLMHECEERGKLVLNGQPMPEDALSRLLGLDKQILSKTVSTLLTYGVASLESDTGILICRRMVRDEHIRQIRSKAGKMGGNPGLVKQNTKQIPTTGVKQIPTPSSSSSVSSSSSDHSPKNGKASSDKDPRHHEITSQWGERFKAFFQFECAMNGGRDGKALQNILKAFKGSSSEFLRIAEDAWRASTTQYAKATKLSVTISGLCTSFDAIRAETMRMNGNGHTAKSEPGEFRTYGP